MKCVNADRERPKRHWPYARMYSTNTLNAHHARGLDPREFPSDRWLLIDPGNLEMLFTSFEAMVNFWFRK
jgi:hypothetical protein